MPDFNIGDIRYNPIAGAYEARVDINRKGRTYRYPCSVSGSLMLDEDLVRRRIARQAQRMAGRESGLQSVL